MFEDFVFISPLSPPNPGDNDSDLITFFGLHLLFTKQYYITIIEAYWIPCEEGKPVSKRVSHARLI